MTNDRSRRKNTSGWTPQILGLSALTDRIIGSLPGLNRRHADRYPRPVQGNAERRRRMRQLERLGRKPAAAHASA